MTKTRGVLVFARNNGHIDYVKQAAFLADRVKYYLDLPTSIITDSPCYLNDNFSNIFDQVISLEKYSDENSRLYFDGAMSHASVSFNNRRRADAYALSPYSETLLLDTDVVICNDMYKNCFMSANDFLIYKQSQDLGNVRDVSEFKYISERSVEFCWATCIFFRKNEANSTFFDLVSHVQDNWPHYVKVYQLPSAMFRNDFAFSIAIHIMNGFQKGNFAAEMPGKLLYITDKDILWRLQDDEMILLVEKQDRFGEYTTIKTQGQTVHVMNKLSLNRAIDKATNE